VVGSLAGVGLSLTLRDAFAPLKDRAFVVRALVASWVLGPAAALLLLRIIPLERSYAAGLLLLSLAPCAPVAPASMRKAQADPAYLAGFMLLSAVGTVAIMPLAVPRLIEGLTVDALAIARPLLMFACIPLLLGIGARSLDPALAARAHAPVTRVANAAGALALLLIALRLGRGVLDAIGSYAIATEVLFIGGVTAAAHLLGSGLPAGRRHALTMGILTRNLGAALAPLRAVEADPRAMVMIAIAVPVTFGWALLAARWLARPRSADSPFPSLEQFPDAGVSRQVDRQRPEPLRAVGRRRER